MTYNVRVIFGFNPPYVPPTSGTPIYQSSLPLVITSGGDYYFAEDLTYPVGVAAISPRADNISINGNGKLLTYATEGACRGIYTTTPMTNFSLKNCVIKQGAYVPTNDYEYTDAVYLRGRQTNLVIDNNDITLEDFGSGYNNYVSNHGVRISYFGSSAISVSITRNTITMNNPYGSTKGIFLSDGTGLVSGAIGGATGMGNTIYSTRCAGSYRSGGVNLYVNCNGLLVSYNAITALAGTDQFTAGIGGWGVNGAIVEYNTIALNGTQERGIHIDGSSHDNVFRYNDITMNSPSHSSRSGGIRTRYGSYSNEIHHNTVRATGYVTNCMATGGDEGRTNPTPHDNYFHHNTLIYDRAKGNFGVRINEGSLNEAFANNIYQGVGAGYDIEIYGYDTYYIDPDGINKLVVGHPKDATLTDESGISSIHSYGYSGQVNSENVWFYNCGVTGANVIKASGVIQDLNFT